MQCCGPAVKAVNILVKRALEWSKKFFKSQRATFREISPRTPFSDGSIFEIFSYHLKKLSTFDRS